MKKYFCLLLTVVLFLSACGQTTPSGSATQPQSNDMEIMNEAYSNAVPSAFEPITVPHGEDYVIEWEDAGMEAHIRFLLDKPEGDILHSDVWDVQYLAIFPQKPLQVYGHDIMMTEPPNDMEQFDPSYFLLVANQEGIWKYYGDQNFPEIDSLRDLRHFDSLQRFQTAHIPLTDIFGVEQCPHLFSLAINGSRPATLEPLSKMPWLVELSLNDCGELDLTPLEGLPNLRDLTLSQSIPQSLEPLTTLPSLQVLTMLAVVRCPDLEPLTRTTIQYFDMHLGVDGRGQFDHVDYSIFSRMPDLLWLDLTNHTAFDPEDCTALLEGSKTLKYLNIWYTGAAEAIADGDYEPDTSRLEAFTTKPY